MILIVEDDEDRMEWFRQEGMRTGKRDLMVFTKRPDVAIELLQVYPFTHLFLDHDLGCEPAAGRDVATWLIERLDVLPQLKTVVQSVNVVSGPKIEKEMRQVGRECTWVPFPVLEQQGLPWPRFSNGFEQRAHRLAPWNSDL